MAGLEIKPLSSPEEVRPFQDGKDTLSRQLLPRFERAWITADDVRRDQQFCGVDFAQFASQGKPLFIKEVESGARDNIFIQSGK